MITPYRPAKIVSRETLPAGLIVVYHPLLAVAAGTGDVLMSWLREGRANTARGAAHFLRETVGRVRYAGARGQLTVRADSGFYAHALVKVCREMEVRYSITVRQHQSLHNLIEAIPEADWTPIPYWMDGAADVAETRACGHFIIMAVCQTSDYQRNSGLGCSISCVAAPACTLARKRIAGVLSRPSYGLTPLGPNGDCCQPNTGTGTASINDSPVGLTKASGHSCVNIAPTTRIWNT